MVAAILPNVSMEVSPEDLTAKIQENPSIESKNFNNISTTSDMNSESIPSKDIPSEISDLLSVLIPKNLDKTSIHSLYKISQLSSETTTNIYKKTSCMDCSSTYNTEKTTIPSSTTESFKSAPKAISEDNKFGKINYKIHSSDSPKFKEPDILTKVLSINGGRKHPSENQREAIKDFSFVSDFNKMTTQSDDFLIYPNPNRKQTTSSNSESTPISKNSPKDKLNLGEIVQKLSTIFPSINEIPVTNDVSSIDPLREKLTSPMIYQSTPYANDSDYLDLLLTTTSPAVIVNSSGAVWPVKHSAVLEGDIVLGGLMMVHEREDSVTCGPVMPQGGIQALEAMLYTLDRINGDPGILPNITLGAHILDDCDKDTYGLEMAVDFIKGRIFIYLSLQCTLRPYLRMCVCHGWKQC